jgi:UDP-N-acetylglucosamine 3-dehydrogenase
VAERHVFPDTGLVFVGCGAITRAHARRLADTRGLSRYYASRDAGRARAYLDVLGGAGAFASYAEALADPRISVALIATPPHTHLELALAALAAGKHVILEKPAFLRADDVDVARTAAVRAQRRLLVAENYAYRPVVARLWALLHTKALGDVRFVQLNAVKRQTATGWRAASDSSALFEGGVHWASLLVALGLADGRVHKLRAGPSDGPERSSAVVIELENGGVATLTHSWECPGPPHGLQTSRIHGTRGSVVFESNGLLLFTLGGRPRFWLPGPRDFTGFRPMFADLFEALRTGREPFWTLEHARRALELVEAVPSAGPLPLLTGEQP